MNLPPITRENKITVGNIFQIAALILTMGITWGVFTTQVNQAREDVAGIRVDIDTLKQHRFDDNSRMVRVETLLHEILREVRTAP